MPAKKSTSDLLSDEARANELQQLGFTGYEAKVYLALLRFYPATAYELSKQAGLPRANVYNALTTLERKLAVQPVNENPVRYVPVDPRQLLDRIQRETASRCDSLADQLLATKAVQPTEFVWTLSGDAHIQAKMSDMIANAKKHIWLKGAHHNFQFHLDELRDAAKRGVEILVILFAEPHQLELYKFGRNSKAYLHESSGVRVGLSDSLITVTTDFEEAMTAGLGPNGYGVFTRSRPVVTMAESLIRHELYVAEIFVHFGKQLDKTFGPALYALRHQYLPEEHIPALDQVLGITGKTIKSASALKKTTTRSNGRQKIH
jgi:sugar-specific transcriptional regulator TrmB